MVADSTSKKLDKIKEDIKKAKAKKIKAQEYLSNGNEEYCTAIKAVRWAGYWGIAAAALYILTSVFTIFSFANILSSTRTQVESGRIFLAVILCGTLVGLSIFLRVCMGKLYQLSVEPSRIKKYLITNIVVNVLPIILGLISGYIVIPGIIGLLSIGFSVSALNNFAVYQEWFEGYGKAKGEHASKSANKKNNDHNDSRKNVKEQSEDYDDGL